MLTSSGHVIVFMKRSTKRSRAQPTCSAGSPRVVDHETPGAVCLTPQNICGLCRQLHRFAVCPGSSKRPRRRDEGQFTGFKDPRHGEVECALHRNETGQCFTHARYAVPMYRVTAPRKSPVMRRTCGNVAAEVAHSRASSLRSFTTPESDWLVC